MTGLAAEGPKNVASKCLSDSPISRHSAISEMSVRIGGPGGEMKTLIPCSMPVGDVYSVVDLRCLLIQGLLFVRELFSSRRATYNEIGPGTFAACDSIARRPDRQAGGAVHERWIVMGVVAAVSA
jgi:hypothetical protein